MSITLKKIWEYPAEALRPVLLHKGRNLTGNLQFDRAVVATIYFNANMLAPIDRQWVANPNFAAVAKRTTDLNNMIYTLKRPFLHKLVSAYAFLFSVENLARKTIRTYSLRNVLEEDLMMSLYQNPIYTLSTSNYNFTTRRVDYTNDDAAGIFYKLLWAASEGTPFERKGLELMKHTDISPNNRDLEPKATALFDAAAAKMLTEAKTRVVIPSVVDALATVALKIATQVQVVNGHHLEAITALFPMSPQIFDYIDIMIVLFAFDIPNMEPTFRCYYLFWLWSLLGEVPPMPQRDVLVAKLDGLIKQYGYEEIFAEVPDTTAMGLSPLTGNLDKDTKAGLSHLIGGFVGKPPSREEVLARIALM